MNKQDLNDRIYNRIGRNKYYQTAVVTNDNVRKEFDSNNDILSELAEYIKTHNDIEYNRGLDDAWELVKKIYLSSGYRIEDLRKIFGISGSFILADILREYTPQEALAKVKEYEKKKAEPVVGDVVKVIDNGNPYNTYHGVYLGTMDYSHYIQERGSHCPTTFNKNYFTLKKLDQHVDLEGWNLEE